MRQLLTGAAAAALAFLSASLGWALYDRLAAYARTVSKSSK